MIDTEVRAKYSNLFSQYKNKNLMGKHITVLRTYHKSGALSQLDKTISHSLDALTNDLLIQNLVLA